MILTVEIEQFTKDIEEKLPQLEGKALQNAVDKVAVLNRVSIEFMEYEDLMRKLALQNNDYKSNYWKLQVQMKDMKSQIKDLESELKTVKENIN